MSLPDAARPTKRFRRGGPSLLAFINQHLPEDDQLNLKDLYKVISRGTIRVGRDGRTLIGEEGHILEQLDRAAGVSAKVEN